MCFHALDSDLWPRWINLLAFLLSFTKCDLDVSVSSSGGLSVLEGTGSLLVGGGGCWGPML